MNEYSLAKVQLITIFRLQSYDYFLKLSISKMTQNMSEMIQIQNICVPLHPNVMLMYTLKESWMAILIFRWLFPASGQPF